MTGFRKAGRSLFVLALFHMAGGPVVLGVLLLFVKLAGLHTHCQEGGSRTTALESSALHSLWIDVVNDSPSPIDSKPAPHSSKDHTVKAKVKFLGMIDEILCSFGPIESAEGKDPDWSNGFAAHLGLPPPVPPPRWV